MLDQFNQTHALLTGDQIHLFVRVNAALPHDHRNQLGRQQIRQGIVKLFVGIFFEISEQSLSQLLRRERRLEIDHRPQTVDFMPDARRSGEYQRSTDPEMGKKHLSEIFKYFFGATVNAETDIFEGQALQLSDPLIADIHRNQRRRQRGHDMTGPLRKAVTVARGSRRRISQSAGSHDHRVRVQRPEILQPHASHFAHLRKFLVQDKLTHGLPKNHLDIIFFEKPLHCPNHVGRFVGLRKDPLPALHL